MTGLSRDAEARRRDGRRLLLAFAIAILLHEVLAALIPVSRPAAVLQAERVVQVTIARKTPPPAKPPERKRPAIVPRTIAIAPIRTVVHRAPAVQSRSRQVAHARPVGHVAFGSEGSGTGDASGAGSGGDIADTSAEPCGYVEFSDLHGSRFDSDGRGFFVDVEMSVHFPDGHAESVLLDYPWYYTSSALNPWSDENVKNPHFPTTFQLPPADKRAGEPAIVRYVIAHSTSNGFTRLRECPASTPSA